MANKFIKGLTEVSSLANDDWLIVQPDAVESVANKIKKSNLGISGLEKQEIAATLAIPFNKLITKITPLTIIGATEFTVNTTGAEYGNITYIRVTADGTNEPTYGGLFQKWLASRTYDNTSGTVNVIAFWFDGVSYYYSIGQGEAVSAPLL